MINLEKIRQVHLNESGKLYKEIDKYKNIIRKQKNDDMVRELTFEQAIYLLKEGSDTGELFCNEPIAEKIEFIKRTINELKEVNRPYTLLPILIIENVNKEIKIIYSDIKQTSNEDFDEEFQLIRRIYLSTKDVYSLVAIYNITESLMEYIRLLVELTYTGSNIVVNSDNKLELVNTLLEEIQTEIRELFNSLDYMRIKLYDM